MNPIVYTHPLHGDAMQGTTTFLLRDLRELREEPIRYRLRRLRRLTVNLRDKINRIAYSQFEPGVVWRRLAKESIAFRERKERVNLELAALEAILRRGAR